MVEYNGDAISDQEWDVGDQLEEGYDYEEERTCIECGEELGLEVICLQCGCFND